MPQDTIYSPDRAEVNGTKVTLDVLLKTPRRVERRLSNMSLERMLANYIFSKGEDAVGGAVIYDRLGLNQLYTARDVQQIEPMAEFPLLTDDGIGSRVAAVAKYGGAFEVSYEQKRRNAFDVFQRKTDLLANTIARKVDTVSMLALSSDVDIAANQQVAAAKWSDPSLGNPIGDLVTASSWINNRDLGYAANTVLINPASEVDIFNNTAIRNALPRESTTGNPLLAGRINGLLGFTWYASNRIPAGTAYVLEAGKPGSLHDEVPMYSRVTDQPRNESWLIQGARVCVPVITDPFSIRKIVGI